MARRFFIDSPEQLQELETAKLLKEGGTANTAQVWRASQRQGKTAWDGKIGVCFRTEGRERSAVVYRMKADGDEAIVARLKYNLGLEWCKNNLREAQHG